MLKFKEPRRCLRRDADPIGGVMQIMWLHLLVPRSHLIYYFSFLLFPSISRARSSKPVTSRAWTLRTAKILRCNRRLKRRYKEKEKTTKKIQSFNIRETSKPENRKERREAYKAICSFFQVLLWDFLDG